MRERKSMKGAVWGPLFGGFAWILLLGIVLRSVPLIIGSILATVAGGVLLRRPGTIVLWIAGGNLLVVNLYYECIPETAFGISTGKEAISLWLLNTAIVALALVGSWLLIRRRGS
jgi:hypothetical protein